MQVVVVDRNGEHEFDLRISRPDATVSDLAVALGGEPTDGLTIDGRFIGPDNSLLESGLCDGSECRIGRARRPDATNGAVELNIIGGPDAGRCIPLPTGAFVIGSDEACDVVISDRTVSRRHCRVDVTAGGVTVTNLSERSGIWLRDHYVDTTQLTPLDVIELGDVELQLSSPRVDDRPRGIDPARHATAAGTIPFNRPPRMIVPTTDSPLEVPAEPAALSKPPFNVVSLVAPALMAAVMVVVVGDPRYAIFAGLSPVMMVGNWYESRRRTSKSMRRGSRDFNDALVSFRNQLSERRQRATDELHERLPNPAEVIRRATAPSVRLWERRPHHADFLVLSAGVGDIKWRPPLANDRAPRAEEVLATMAEYETLSQAPVALDLSNGGVVGITGDRDRALALARSLVVQAAIHHGPADVAIALFCSPRQNAEWTFAKWLPHTRDSASGRPDLRLVATERADQDELLDALLARSPSADGRVEDPPTLLAVFDGDTLLTGRVSPGRDVLRGAGGPVAGIVLAPTVDRLPASCTAIVSVGGPGQPSSLQRTDLGDQHVSFLVNGLSEATARRAARSVARFDDPELRVAGAGLPDVVRLPGLLDLPMIDPEGIARRWAKAKAVTGLVAPIGVSEDGPFVIDLVHHGPHGLIGGTTGSGKSELLRSLVASFAATYDPDRITFGLFDFKGGATFEDFTALPHTVGAATDLDVQLAERALRCLRAELTRRSRVFLEAGVSDISSYAASVHSSSVPVPRLLVVIDEFAALAAEFPDLMSNLVDISQRGRSLGVHLLLAAQKPSSVVNEDMRTNMRLRIALKVEDAQDSVDIIRQPDAALIRQIGRAYVRRGEGDVEVVQTALSTGTSLDGATTVIDAAPFLFGRVSRPREEDELGEERHEVRRDLDRIIEAVNGAFGASGRPAPRRPWPDPLPDDVPLASLLTDADVQPRPRQVVIGLADDPDQQTQYPAVWNFAAGNLLLYGVVGSGTTTTLATIGLSLASRWSPDAVHLYVLDLAAGELQAFTKLPHTGAVVGAVEKERQARFIRFLRAELDRRKAAGPLERMELPVIVTLLDNLPALVGEANDLATMELVDQFSAVYADGPEVGLFVAATVDRAGGVPSRLASATTQKVLFKLADSFEYGSFGVTRKQIPRFRPGRAVLAVNGQEIQIAVPSPSLESAVDEVCKRAASASTPPFAIRTLPPTTSIEELVPAAHARGNDWFLPVGVGEREIEPAGLWLYEGDHGLIAGPGRSGRSTLLCRITEIARATLPDVTIVGFALRRSPLRDTRVDTLVTSAADIAVGVAAATTAPGCVLVLVDDADSDESGQLAGVLATGRTDLHVIASGRPDVLRAMFGHWTQSVRRSKVGILLEPNLDIDGDMFGLVLPRRGFTLGSHRGLLVNNGDVELVQT